MHLPQSLHIALESLHQRHLILGRHEGAEVLELRDAEQVGSATAHHALKALLHDRKWNL